MQAIWQQVIAAGAQSLDLDTLADEVAWWTRQVTCDPRIGAGVKAEIAARFAEGLALARVGTLPASGRVDQGADEGARLAAHLGRA